ncbi:acVLRF1 family peptidyl-tRNA hydrolase [Microlunatus speluncae]|uniref:acVLRF1 family peptidyl-tRNA hydrolase n=1 Tax=Microlunatus speluncae TaxID=2594267 RepID=UPI001266442F|nr:acVLRF1 family peptidyl-tRNA hydrolase [Microlunatus speluncae]
MISRTVTVAADRLPAWIDGFRRRHGELHAVRDGDQVMITAADEAVAVITVPFPPLPDAAEPIPALLEQVAAERRIGALLVRRSGYAIGVFAGAELIISKVGSRYVQGKTKAGGWSQQRFARRRDNQATALYGAVADQAHRLLSPEATRLTGLATGGDRAGIDAVLEDQRLAPLRDLVLPRLYPVPDPKLAVLREFPRLFNAVQIGLNDLA